MHTNEVEVMRAQFARLRAELDPIVLQAVIAAALSFAHLHDVAYAAGQGGWKAWAYPVSVDLLMVAAWRRTKSADGRAGAWFWFAVALTASVGANVVTAGVLDLEHPPTLLLFHSRKDDRPTEAPSDELQLPATEPLVEVVEEEVQPSTAEPQRPILVTYAEAAERLRLSEVTVRGAANGGRLRKYEVGPTPGRIHVDLGECLRNLRHDVPVNA
jgi:hypothetical protein